MLTFLKCPLYRPTPNLNTQYSKLKSLFSQTMKYIFSLIFLTPLLLQAQNYPQNYFITPLDTPLVITGSFGEIRDNHLHSGIDISTGDDEGLPVYAAADGYVSRVKVAPDGYGKAIYITHPNGYVTVYGHLQKFTSPLSDQIRKMQYERQSFELDEKFADGQFLIRQRDIIAYSGSTGGTDGPHLHFEIRDEKTEEPINPFLFGVPYKDNIRPEIKYVRIIPQREGGILNTTDSAETYDLVPNESKGFRLNVLENPVVYGKISFAIGASDRADSSDSELNIYSAELYVDGKQAFTFTYDRFSFDNTRDVNAHIDYLSKERDNQTFQRLMRMPGDRLSIYGRDTLVTGMMNFEEDKSHEIRIVVKDYKGNFSEAEFVINCYKSLAENQYQPHNPDGFYVTMQKSEAVHKSDYDVVIPEGAAYEEFYYEDDVQESNDYYSDIYFLGNEFTPLRKSISVGIKPKVQVPDSLKNKLLVVRIGQYDILKACGGQWNGKLVSAKSNSFGKFVVMLDTTPPAVEKFYVPADLNSMYGGEVRIRIKDDLSGIKSYSGKVDGKWRLFEYDKKENMIISNVDGVMDNKEHPIEITVTDERGNTRVWQSSFYF